MLHVIYIFGQKVKDVSENELSNQCRKSLRLEVEYSPIENPSSNSEFQKNIILKMLKQMNQHHRKVYQE